MAPRRLGVLPLLPIAPAIVILVGVAVALAVTLFGLRDLRRASDRAADLRAEAVASTLAARLRVTGSEDWREIVERVGQRSGIDVLLIDQDASIVADGSLGALPERELLFCLIAGQGEIETRLGRTRFASRPLGARLERLSVLAFVPAPATPPEAARLAQATGSLTALFVGVAFIVAYLFAKDVRDDVGYITRRIRKMAGAEHDPVPSIAKIPIRSLDPVGTLTAAFNLLADRFAAAERSYRQDLKLAVAHENSRAAFLSALSHELRTPLNAVLGFTDILRSEIDGPLSKSAREDLAVVRKSAAHLASLIDDILDLSALESGKLRLDRRAVELYAIAEEVVRELEPLALEKGLGLRLIGKKGHIVHADPRRLRQILGNVIDNAVKFTARGSVRVEVSRQDDEVLLTIIDTGPGIAPAERAAIFEEYRQAGDPLSRPFGTGLGLAITRRLVDMHGGRIELESETGKGSRFTIALGASEAPT